MNRSNPVVRFYYSSPPFRFPERKRLKQFLVSLFEQEHHTLLSLNYIFCTDNYLLEINQQYLQHDTFTDIITFDLGEKDGSKTVTGEIYISIDRVRENAGKFNTGFNNELLRVIFHGALHLCGYKDKSRKDLVAMRSAEDHYLNLFIGNDVPRGTNL